MQWPLALAIACAEVFVLANVFPLVSLNVQGQTLSTTLPEAAWALYRHDMRLLAALVFLTTLLAPAIEISAILTLLVSFRMQVRPVRFQQLFRLVVWIRGWGMLDVLMLGILVSLVKLAALATIVPGIALFAFAALLILLSLLNTSFNTADLWRWSGMHSR